MALSIHASTPAVATGSPTATTASFTPPSGALILIQFSGNSTSGASPSTPTITDNLGVHLTYTLLDFQSRASAPTVDGQCAQWSAVATGSAMTISVTNNASSTECSMRVRVLTDSGGGTPTIGAHGKNGSASAASIAQSYTAAASGGWGFLAVCDWDLKGNETAGTGCTIDSGDTGNVGSQFNFAYVRRSSADDSVGVANTLNATLPATSTNLGWVYAEVLPAAGGAASPDPVAGPYTGLAPGMISPTGAFRPIPWDFAAPTAQVSAEQGPAVLGVAASGTARKVAVQGGSSALGVAGAATVRKVAVPAGSAVVGVVGTSVDRKVAVQAGPSVLGLAATRTSATVARAQSGSAVLGLAATGRAAKVTGQAGRAVVGLVTTGTDRKVAPAAGSSVLGLAGTRTSAAAARAQSGTSLLGLVTTGTDRKVAAGRGTATAGVLATGTDRKVAAEVARGALGLAGASTDTKRATGSGRAALVLSASFVKVVAAFNAVSAPTVTASRTSTPAVSAGRGGTATAGASRTSTPTVAGKASSTPAVNAKATSTSNVSGG